MNIPCPKCGNDVQLSAAKDVPRSDNTGSWCRYSCECGAEGFICETDYQRYAEAVERRKLRKNKPLTTGERR